MMGQKELPKVTDLVDYNFAVAGHAGTLCDLDGSLFIKPCTQQEIDFYNTANAKHKSFAQLMPTCYGELKLVGGTDVQSLDAQLPILAEHLSPELKEQVVQAAQESQSARKQVEASAHRDDIKWAPGKNRKISTDIAVALDNAAHGFRKPNILDCKLGERLWADDAPKEKRERFDKITKQTTHKNFGFRIAGMRVYRGSDDTHELDDEEYKIYDKDYGRLSVNDDNVTDAFRKFIFNNYAGVDRELGKLIAGAFLKDLRYVQKVLEEEESRMYSASLLFVFEGDGEALREKVDDILASEQMSQSEGDECRITQSGNRVDSGINMDEEGGSNVQSEESDMSDDDDDEVAFRRVHSLHLIDFAHAKWTPGQGPDENCLKGVRSLVRIFEELSGDSDA